MNPHAQDPLKPAQNGQDGHAQESNAATLDDPSPRPKDPRIPGERPATTGPATGAQSATEDTGVDPHEVRARLTRRGAVQGLELDAGDGVVWVPQWALPDLRRRLYLAQQKLTAASGPVPGKRRRPASARA